MQGEASHDLICMSLISCLPHPTHPSTHSWRPTWSHAHQPQYSMLDDMHWFTPFCMFYALVMAAYFSENTRALTSKKSSHMMTIMKKYVVRVTSRFWGNSPLTNNIWKPWCVQWSENITTWGRGWSHSHQSRARPHPTYIPHSNLYIHPTYILLLTFICPHTPTYNTIF